jgi:hypothetical protein
LLWGRLRNCNTSSKILLNKERPLTTAELRERAASFYPRRRGEEGLDAHVLSPYTAADWHVLGFE